MTLAQAISRTLRRAGLTQTETEEQDRARECLSMILAEDARDEVVVAGSHHHVQYGSIHKDIPAY